MIYSDMTDLLDAGTDRDVFLKILSTQGIISDPYLVTYTSSLSIETGGLAVDNLGNMYVGFTTFENLLDSGTDSDIFLSKIIVTPSTPKINMKGTQTTSSVYFSWSPSAHAEKYLVYKDTNIIYNISGLTPIAETTGLSYSEKLSGEGTYYYAVVAHNKGFNSTPSENVVYVVNQKV